MLDRESTCPHGGLSFRLLENNYKKREKFRDEWELEVVVVLGSSEDLVLILISWVWGFMQGIKRSRGFSVFVCVDREREKSLKVVVVL